MGNTKGRGTNTFIRQLYDTAGTCIECDHRECIETGEDIDKYGGDVLVIKDMVGFSCGVAGVTIENHADTGDVIESVTTPQRLRENHVLSQAY